MRYKTNHFILGPRKLKILFDVSYFHFLFLLFVLTKYKMPEKTYCQVFISYCVLNLQLYSGSSCGPVLIFKSAIRCTVDKVDLPSCSLQILGTLQTSCSLEFSPLRTPVSFPLQFAIICRYSLFYFSGTIKTLDWTFRLLKELGNCFCEKVAFLEATKIVTKYL